MEFQLTHPFWLLTLPFILAWVFWMAWKTDVHIQNWRRWAAFCVRVLVVTSVVLALSGLQWKKTQEGMNKCMNSQTKCLDRIYCLLFLLCLVMTLTVLLVFRLIQKFDPDAFKEITGSVYNDTIGELTKTNSSGRLLR